MKNNKLKALLIAAGATCAIAANLACAQPSAALTGEEVGQAVEQIGQALGVWQRFMQDLEKTRRGSSNRTPQIPRRQIEPETQPQQFPSSDDWTQETEEAQGY